MAVAGLEAAAETTADSVVVTVWLPWSECECNESPALLANSLENLGFLIF